MTQSRPPWLSRAPPCCLFLSFFFFSSWYKRVARKNKVWKITTYYQRASTNLHLFCFLFPYSFSLVPSSQAATHKAEQRFSTLCSPPRHVSRRTSADIAPVTCWLANTAFFSLSPSHAQTLGKKKTSFLLLIAAIANFGTEWCFSVTNWRDCCCFFLSGPWCLLKDGRDTRKIKWSSKNLSVKSLSCFTRSLWGKKQMRNLVVMFAEVHVVMLLSFWLQPVWPTQSHSLNVCAERRHQPNFDQPNRRP